MAEVLWPFPCGPLARSAGIKKVRRITDSRIYGAVRWSFLINPQHNEDYEQGSLSMDVKFRMHIKTWHLVVVIIAYEIRGNIHIDIIHLPFFYNQCGMAQKKNVHQKSLYWNKLSAANGTFLVSFRKCQILFFIQS